MHKDCLIIKQQIIGFTVEPLNCSQPQHKNLKPTTKTTYLSEHIFQGKVIQKQLPRIYQPLVFGALKDGKDNGVTMKMSTCLLSNDNNVATIKQQ